MGFEHVAMLLLTSALFLCHSLSRQPAEAVAESGNEAAIAVAEPRHA